MSDTHNFALPLLASNQAQKHVTMNEALTRLDALSAPSVLSADLTTPPESPAENDAYVIPVAASEAWAGHENELAFFSNGGWSFATPKAGWRVWVTERGEAIVFSGDAWLRDPVGPIEHGAYMRAGVIVADIPVAPGFGFDADLSIPDRAVVVGVTGRVVSTIAGPNLTGWRLGVSGATDRYGSSIGLPKNSVVNGVTSAPLAYYALTPLRVEPEGGSFAEGEVRLAIHYLALTPPDLV